jgi:N-acetylneuraminic acid mutarotase
MKRIYFQLFSLFVLCALFSCHKNSIPYTQSGNWVTESQLNGPARSEAVSFVIGNFAYLGTGYDGLNTRYNDFWRYDPSNNIWSQVSSMPDGTERSSAFAMSINNKGYVGTGYTTQGLYLQDYYEFDPTANTWSRKADFLGGARYEAVAFGIGTLGYAGTGFDGSNALKDFYQYDPVADTWTDVGFSGNKRYGAVAFVYNNKGYVVTGVNSGTMQTDFWVFNPASDTLKWSELNHISNYSSDAFDDSYTTIARWNGSAFVIGDFAYISTGENGIYYTYTWQYEFATDLWTEKTPFEGPPTTGAVGFSVAGLGFIATGRSAPGQAGASDYLRQFQPNVTENPNDN